MKPTLTYFDAPISRGEECRLALHLANVDFTDNRIKFADWAALKPSTPYGAIPTLALEGKPVLAHSNAILVYLGRTYNLHPSDTFEAARHEAMMCHVEDMRAVLGPTIRMGDEEKKKAREEIASNYLPAWAAAAEKNISAAPFFGGAQLNVVDLKIHLTVRWITGGKLDHISPTLFEPFKKLIAISEAVKNDTRILAWYAKK